MASPFPVETAPSGPRHLADRPGLLFKNRIAVTQPAHDASKGVTLPANALAQASSSAPATAPPATPPPQPHGQPSPPHASSTAAAVAPAVTAAPPKILPKPGEPNVLITSALPYVNNVPHLGNIIGSTLSADVYARYSRSRNRNTLYICGTDEYGTATETKALEEKVAPQQLCDKYHALHAQVYQWFRIGFDHFGRTTTPAQTVIAQDIFLKLQRNGYLEERSMTQLFCPNDERFLADRYVEGTCPKCGYEDARGDQCDSCGQLLDAIELISPRCKLCNTSPVKRDSRHMFLRIDRLQPETEAWAKQAAEHGGWSANGRYITESWFREGLRPFSLTRDLKWGVPVPVEGMRDKVLYVWFDAPIGYPSITANYTDEWEKWWKNPDHVRLYQFMGKDNVRFHTVIFPSCLIGTGEAWTKLHHISTTEYLQYEGGKFSKSRNIGVFGDKAGDIGVTSSVWRYYLLANRPETGDAHFSWREFVQRNNSELLANLGNLVNRALSFLAKKYDGVLPELPKGLGLEAGPAPLRAEAIRAAAGGKETPFSRLVAETDSLLVQYATTMDAVKLRQGLTIVMALSTQGNVFLQEVGLDNNLFTKRRDECDALMLVVANLIWTLSSLVHPFMPETSDAMCAQLNVPPRAVPVEDVEAWDGDAPRARQAPPPRPTFALDLLPGHRIGKPAHLFQRFDEKMEQSWRAKFGGGTAAAAAAEVGDQAGGGAAGGGKKGAAAGSGGGGLSKKAAEKAAKAAKKAAAAASAAEPREPTPEWRSLDAQVKAQAETVRRAKTAATAAQKQQPPPTADGIGEAGQAASKADSSSAAVDVDAEVAKLLRLKTELQELTQKLVALEVGGDAKAGDEAAAAAKGGE